MIFSSIWFSQSLNHVGVNLKLQFLIKSRDAAKSKNLLGQVLVRHAATARRRLLIRQNLGGQLPPLGVSLYNMQLLEIFKELFSTIL